MESVLVGLAASFVMFFVTWLGSVYWQKDVSLIDRVWGMAFVFNAWGGLSPGIPCRSPMVTACSCQHLGHSTVSAISIFAIGVTGKTIATKICGPDINQDFVKSFFTIFMLQFGLAGIASTILCLRQSRTTDPIISRCGYHPVGCRLLL